MIERNLAALRELLAACTPAEQKTFFQELRQQHLIHEFEEIIGAPAEMILEAVHRAPELTRRMLRGVIADAAFRSHVISSLENQGWRDATPEGNFAYDYMVEDGQGPITVQVKLQRSSKGAPLVQKGARYGFDGRVFVVEPQKTRKGNNSDGEETRPYRYGEFDVLAVSMQPSTGAWNSYMYTLSRWLLPGEGDQEIAKYQPVSMQPGEFWTDDFITAAAWLRANDDGKQMSYPDQSKGSLI